MVPVQPAAAAHSQLSNIVQLEGCGVRIAFIVLLRLASRQLATAPMMKRVCALTEFRRHELADSTGLATQMSSSYRGYLCRAHFSAFAERIDKRQKVKETSQSCPIMAGSISVRSLLSLLFVGRSNTHKESINAMNHLNEKHAAAFLGLSPRTLQKFRTNGFGPEFRKFGRVVRYKPAELEQWAESMKRKNTSERG